MKELLQILHKARALSEAGRDFALATVVKIGGSTYRRPGARMLVADDGTRWGALSGGCLEGEVAQQALNVIQSGQPQLIPFNLAEDDIVLGFGTGCDGIVHVLIQPQLSNHPPFIIDALNYSVINRNTCILATVIAGASATEAAPGNHFILSEEGATGPSTLSAGLTDIILPQCIQFLKEERLKPQMYLWHTLSFESPDGHFQVLFEFVRPPIKLFIFGEGYDVYAVVSQAALMGWEIVVVGRKPPEVLQERFPLATDWKFLMHPEDVLSIVLPDNRSAALVMNHTFSRDRDIMRYLLDSNVPYIGMLGPRERTSQMLTETSTQIKGSPTKIFGPVGLDIGTETPEEIALSAIAEIQAVLHKRQGASLRNRQSPIHTARNTIKMLD